MFVLDTNTLVYFFRGEGSVAGRLLATPPALIAVPTLVVYELETGIAKSMDRVKRRGQLDALLRVVHVLPFGVEEAKAAAGVRAKLEAQGTPIGPIDTLIAGVALAHRGVLVTRNVREFGRVEGLATEDWYVAAP
jgi:tRNA(fMet)-specific endonuclease VapC